MNNTKNILYTTLILLACSCKKEAADNPNITHRTVNLEMKVSSFNANSDMEIDINDDGVSDFKVGLDLTKNTEYDLDFEAVFAYEQAGSQLLTQTINSTDYIKNSGSGDVIGSTSVTWSNYANVFEIERFPGSPDVNDGFAGKGDVLVGVRFKIGTDLHYGWMKVNAAADYKSIVVKEVAYDIRPEIEIKAGEK